ncbi:MAG: TIM barrel protein [Deltaproteobacteria bacterium]
MTIRAASAPVSWGIQENVPLPADYTYSRVLDEIAEAGYIGTELGPYGFLPTDPDKLRQELEKRGLTLCSAFVEFQLGNRAAHAEGIKHVAESAKLISAAGARLLILSDSVVPERSTTAGRREESNRRSWNESEWQAAAEAVREVIRISRRAGLDVAFHHHVGTHVETPEEVDRIFALLSSYELGLCLDTGHYVYGGGDAAAFLERNLARIRCVHLKDVSSAKLEEARKQKLDFHAAIRHGVFVPLGQGVVEFHRVIELLNRQKFDGWVVTEQDVLEGGCGAASPFSNAKAAREFLKMLGV